MDKEIKLRVELSKILSYSYRQLSYSYRTILYLNIFKILMVLQRFYLLMQFANLKITNRVLISLDLLAN